MALIRLHLRGSCRSKWFDFDMEKHPFQLRTTQALTKQWTFPHETRLNEFCWFFLGEVGGVELTPLVRICDGLKRP